MRVPVRNASAALRAIVSISPTGAAAASTVAMEEWGLSVEELDNLEKAAIEQLSARRNAAPVVARPELLARTIDGRAPLLSVSSPRKTLKVKVCREDDKIGVCTPYDLDMIAAVKSVRGYEWDPSKKQWKFPENNLQDVVAAITRVPTLDVNVEAVAPLVFPPVVAQMIRDNSRSSEPTGFSQISPAKSQENLRTPSKPVIVRISISGSDRICARSAYHEGVKQACQSVEGKIWNKELSMWTFPKTSLTALVDALQKFPNVKIEAIPPLDLPPSYVTLPVASCSSPQLKLSQEGSSCPVVPKEDDTMSNVKPRVQMLLHSTGVVAVKSPPCSRLISVLKSIPKAFWSQKERMWMFPPTSLVEAENALASISLVEPLPSIVKRALQHMCHSENLSDKYRSIPSHLEESLLPFQRDGIRFVLQHGGRVLIADEMGLGKTVQAIAFASCLEQEWPVLVIVPSSLRMQWATMLKTWLRVPPGDITIVLSGGASIREGFKIVHSAGKTSLELDGAFNIISYDMVAKLHEKSSFKVVIADESHYMKNPQAKRTLACVPIIQKARYAVLLTGTPVLSRPIELFKQLEALAPSVYVDVHEYGQRYCSGGLFGIHQGASNHEELHALLKSTVMIRRLKREVLTELPEKFRLQVYLSLDLKNTKQLRALFQQLKQLRDGMRPSLEDGLEKLKAEEKILINKIYSESAVAKLSAVQDYLSTMLEADCKFLVFAHHQSMMDGIEDHLKKKKTQYIRIDGGTPGTARQSLVTRFQQSDDVKAALLSIRAAGIGLTLTAASTIVFAEMSWTPGDLVQAEDRAHRLGQKSSVNIYYLHAQETIDDMIWESVRHKLENLGQVLNGKEEKLHVIPSPPSHRQAKLTNYLRPCENSAESGECSHDLPESSKRRKLFFE